jgi:hypothetical protein
MPTATNTHTTPTRRSTLGFSVAAIIAGMTTPVLAAATAPNPDAELIAACEEAIRHDGIKDAINRGEFDDDDDAADDARDAWWEAFERVETMPATTKEGVRAKARVLKLAVHDRVCSHVDWTVANDGDMHERMADALCDEILALGGAA